MKPNAYVKEKTTEKEMTIKIFSTKPCCKCKKHFYDSSKEVHDATVKNECGANIFNFISSVEQSLSSQGMKKISEFPDTIVEKNDESWCPRCYKEFN